MNLTLPKTGRRTAVLLTTLVLILAAFAYYFLIYVKGNESDFIDRSYRVLDRKSQNIQKKYAGYQNYLEFVYNTVSGKVGKIIDDEKKQRDQIKLLKYTIDKLTRQELGSEVKNEKLMYQSPVADQISRLKSRMDRLTSGLDKKVNESIADMLLQAAPENTRLDYYYSNKDDSVLYERPDYNYYYEADAFNWLIEGNDRSTVSFSEGADSFVASLLNNDFFDEYVLLKEGYSFDNFGNDFNYSIIYQSFPNPIDLVSISPILQSPYTKELHKDSVYLAMGPKMIRPVEVELYNEKYKMLFHRMQIADDTYYLGGFVKSSVFKKESQKVEVFLLVVAILLILLLLISMPILKLVIMSSIERLHIRNVTMVGGAIVLGVPLVLLTFFSIYEFVIQGNQEIDRDLQTISTSIEDEFLDEVNTMITLLQEYNKKVRDSDNCPSAIASLDFKEYLEFNHVFWIDSSGIAKNDMQRTLLTPEPATIDVSSREYFQKIVNDQTWRMRGKVVGSPFYLQSIVSWSDFTNEVAVSIPSGIQEYPVAVMTSQLHSVMETILPAGYGFAIVDQEGLVKFHQDKDRILQENFLDETNHSDDIMAAIYSRMAMPADIKYRNVNHRAYIQPINALPLYLITFYDNQYRNAKIQGVLSISIILLISSFAAACLMGLILKFILAKRSKLRIKTFLFHWLKPVDTKYIEYQFLSVLFFLIGAIVLLMIYFEVPNEEDILFIFIITNAYLFLLSFTWLAPKQSVSYTERPSDRRNFNIAFIVFIIAADWLYLPNSSGLVWLIVYQILLLVFVLSSRRIEPIMKKTYSRIVSPKMMSKEVKHHSYNVFLFSWLMISSILPIFFIFMVAHNEEEIIWEKYNQLHVAKQYQEKIRIIHDKVKLFRENKDSLTYKDHLFYSKLNSGNYLLSTSTAFQGINGTCQIRNDKALELLSMLRPHYNELIIESKGLAFNASDEKTIQWCFPCGNDSTLLFQYQDQFGPMERDRVSTIMLKSSLDPLVLGQGHANESNQADRFRSFFFGTILLILIGVYALIDYCANKIYGREYSNFTNTLPLTVENFKKISIGDDSITHHKQRQIFLLGLPKSNKSNLLKSLEGNYFIADMIRESDEKSWKELIATDFSKYDGVIIENFEYGASSHSVNKERLILLEKLASFHMQQLMISSNVHPSYLTDFYEEKLEALSTSDPHWEELNLALETWRHILGGFIIVHNPIKENEKINAYLKPSWIKDEVYKQLFRMELNKGSFLPNLLPGIKDYFIKLKKNANDNEHRINKEDIILRIQLLAESYYLGLWNTLSKEERYIIYDLARDRFVNINNKNGIRSLLEKGLLVYDNELRIFNESFTNFVLSIIKKEEALIMEKEVRDKGSWSTISGVLGLLLLGVLAFLFLGNPDFFKSFNALISAVLAIAGVIPRLGGMLSFGKSNNGG